MKRVLLVALVSAVLATAGLASAAEKKPLLPPRGEQPATSQRAPRQRIRTAIERQAAVPRSDLARREQAIRLTQDVEAVEEPTPAIATDAPEVDATAPESVTPGPVVVDDAGSDDQGAPVATEGGAAYCGDGCGPYCADGACDGCGGCAECASPRVGLLRRWCACGSMFESFWHETHSGRRFWVEGQTLNWWGRPSNYPPLATSSPAGTPQAIAGVLGQPTTSILFGNEDLDDDERLGGRINFGFWLIDGQFLALQGDYFGLEEEFNNFSVSSPGDPILARPFFNVQTLTPDASIIAGDNIIDPKFGTAPVNLDGAILIETHSRIQGAGASLRKPSWISFDNNYRVNWMAGYRWFNLEEGVSIQDVVFPQGGLFVPGSSFRTFDIFDTENEFHGGEIGLLMEFRKSVWSLDLLGRLAFGNMHHRVDIQGYGVIDDTVSIATVDDGLLALDTNIGNHKGDEFCWIPEVGAKLGLSLTDYFRVTLGYNFMYISSVVRADDQIDLNLNLSQSGGGTLVGPAQPQVNLKDTDFWLHGVSVGGELKF